MWSCWPQPGRRPPTPPRAKALPATTAALSEGIQNQARFVPASGSVAAKMVFVDFPDAPANDSTAALCQWLAPGGQRFLATASYGKLSLRIDAGTSRFARMPVRVGMSCSDPAARVRIDVVSRSGDNYTFNIAFQV
ncbi:hypothetical protein [Dactylosporangium sp. NPDC049140]|jgi:hypothetical protein|uniref:hypothetical protein n=1 Tax=Dactylosporangium sp. NPDC049140 TaxID=3155647 RepID=UPI0033EB87B3